MRIPAIRDGDSTTTGGRVFASGSRINDKGRKIALDGNQATCGHCEGVFRILGTGRNIFNAGKNIAVDLDRVLCPCGKNRVSASAKPGVWVKSASKPAMAATPVREDERGFGSPDSAQFTRWFRATDSESGLPLSNRTFVAKIGSDDQTGKTDADGYAMVKTDDERIVDVHVTFSSPKRDLKPS